MGVSPFAFSAVEQVAIAKILRDFPAAALTLETGVRPILERLIRECRGVLLSEDDVDYVLAGLADRIVGRTIGETVDWGEADELRTAAIDLLTRHLLAGMRAEFVQRVLGRRRGRIEQVPGSTTRDRPWG